jgi:hypothetical protein
MNDYVEKEDDAFSLQLNEHGEALGNLGDALGFEPEEISEAQAEAVFFAYVLARQVYHQAFGENFTEYKNLARRGNGEEILTDPIPSPNANPVPLPITPLADIEGRFRKRANRIKNHPAYTHAMGEALKIVADETEFDPQTGKPILKVKLQGGHPFLKWNKGGWDGVQIWRMVSAVDGPVPGPDAVFEKLERVTGNQYTDNSPLPLFGQAQVWHYKVMYTYKNAQVGTVSDIVSIVVTGI